MTARRQALADDAARRDAIAAHDRSFLVEAGAGSGKTAVIAGRIAMLLAEGVAPKHIAAVTFTEFAASELLIRVRAFVAALAAGDIPTVLRVALPGGLSDEQRSNLAAADAALDEMICSTIHGFCQRLITPYPVEADIDPGAGVMDRDQADLVFTELIEAWLREELAGEAGGLLAELVLHDPGATVGLIRTVLGHLRRHPHRPRSSPPPSRATSETWPKKSRPRCRPRRRPRSSGCWSRRPMTISALDRARFVRIGKRGSGALLQDVQVWPRPMPTG